MKKKKTNGSAMRSTPAPPIEEVAEEVNAEEEDGEQLVFETEAKKDGAANGEAAQSNRVRQTILDRKRNGERRVKWGEQNVCLFYDDLVAMWPAQSLVFHVTRLTGTQASWYLNGWPRSGKELYEAVRSQCHGFREETEYSVAIRDSQSKFDRGKGRLTIPSTLDEPRVAPMMPQGVAVPVGLGYAPAPAYAPMPAPPQASDPYVLALQRQVFELQGKLEAFTRAQAPAPAPAPAAPPQQPQPAVPQPIPQQVAPPGQVYFIPGLGYVQSVASAQPIAQQQQQPPPVATPTPDPMGVFRGAIDMAKTSIGAAHDIAALVHPVTAAAAAAAPPASDPPPTQVIDLGDMKIVQNTADGSLRLPETALANSKTIMNWLEKQQNSFQNHQKTIAQIQAGQQPQQQPQQQQAPAQSGMFSAPTFPR